MNSQPTRRRAFSLIELLIAIAILLAIGALVVVNLMPRRDQADIDLMRGQIDQFHTAIELFQVDMKRFPSEEEGLAVLWSSSALENEEDESKWRGPYLKSPKPRDTWGNEWIYTYPSEERADMYEIVSLGPDGEEGTDDDISSFDSLRNEDGEFDESFDDFGSSP